MQSAYDLILDGAVWISTVLAAIAGVSFLFQRHSLVARSVLFAFGYWLAPLFYISYLVFDARNVSVVAFACFIDCIVLSAYYLLFRRLFLLVTRPQLPHPRRLRRWLRLALIVVIALAIPLALQGSVGIFSVTNSRIDYLSDSKWNAYLVYASLSVQGAMIPVIASLVNQEKRWNLDVVAYLIATSVLSLLSGSKGSSILSFISVLSLLKFSSAREYLRVFRVPIASIAAIFVSTVVVVGKFLSLDPAQITSLMGSRVFLSNDARALAIDWAARINPYTLSIFREAFRGYAALLGTGPVNPPLGQYLYTQQLHTSGLLGANASSSALLVAYGNEWEKIVFGLVICLCACAIYLLGNVRGKWAILFAGLALFLLSQLSQDFLAFQTSIHVFILGGAALAMIAVSRSLCLAACQDARVELHENRCS